MYIEGMRYGSEIGVGGEAQRSAALSEGEGGRGERQGAADSRPDESTPALAEQVAGPSVTTHHCRTIQTQTLSKQPKHHSATIRTQASLLLLIALKARRSRP